MHAINIHIEIAPSHFSLVKLMKLDTENIGTPDYFGLAYFWHYDYRHYLRDASAQQRVDVHFGFITAGLPTDGFSDRHSAIVSKVLGVEV